jgi:hypothetical protein
LVIFGSTVQVAEHRVRGEDSPQRRIAAIGF